MGWHSTLRTPRMSAVLCYSASNWTTRRSPAVRDRNGSAQVRGIKISSLCNSPNTDGFDPSGTKIENPSTLDALHETRTKPPIRHYRGQPFRWDEYRHTPSGHDLERAAKLSHCFRCVHAGAGQNGPGRSSINAGVIAEPKHQRAADHLRYPRNPRSGNLSPIVRVSSAIRR